MINNRSNHILAIKTTAKASNGKNNAIATQVLMRNIPEVSQMVVTLVSVSCAKFNKEEYIVTSGPTNHFDLLMRSEIVIESLAAKKLAHLTNQSCLDQDLILTSVVVTRL